MNKTYRTLCNAALATWVAAPESAGGRTRGSHGVASKSPGRLFPGTLQSCAAAVALLLGANAAHAQIYQVGAGGAGGAGVNGMYAGGDGGLVGGGGAFGSLPGAEGASGGAGGGTADGAPGAPGGISVGRNGSSSTSGVDLPGTVNGPLSATAIYVGGGGGGGGGAYGPTAASAGSDGGNGVLAIGLGGAVSVTGDLFLGGGGGGAGAGATEVGGAGGMGGTGTLQMHGGLLDVGGTIYVGGAQAGWLATAPRSGTAGAAGIGQISISASGSVAAEGGIVLKANSVGLDGIYASHAAGSFTFDAAISGDGSVRQAGAGTTILARDNSYTGGTSVSGGTLQVGGGGVAGTLGSGAVAMSNNSMLAFDRADTMVVANTISGAGSIRQQGTGTTVLAADNAYAGTTTIAAGTLQVGNGATAGTLGAGAVVNNGVLDFHRADVVTVGHAISGNGALAQSGVGTTILVGTNTYMGPTTVSAGTLQIGNGGSAGTLGAGAVTNNGVLAFNRMDVVAVGNIITGNGSLEQNGSGTTILTGNNAYVGPTIISKGMLQVGNGGTTGEISGPVTNNAILAFDRSDAIAFAAAIDGSGKVIKLGTGTLTLGGANTYSGGTALKQGRLDVGSNTALGTGELAMDDGTTLGFAADGLTIANNIRLTGSNDPVIDTGSTSQTLSGVISGGGFLSKEGSGTLTLTGANTYTGATHVAAGTLRAGAANTLSAASAMTVASGATLDLAGFSQAIAGMNLGGTASLVGSSPGTTLTVTGPWVGNGGTLALGTALGADSSPTDRVLLSGSSAIASGSTLVRIANLGGLGAQTTGNGIEIISTENGASIGGNAFSLATPVSAGAYDYHLNTTSAGGYLSSTLTPPSDPGTPAAPEVPEVPTYRAEVPLFSALPEQLREAGLAMLGNLHQRVGDDGVTGANASTPDQGYRQAWGRLISIDRSISQGGTVSPASEGRLSGLQTGTDLWADPNWRVGLYVGQLEGEMNVSGFARGQLNYAAGSNDLRTQYLGGYATWKHQGGFYVDTVLQAGRVRYTAEPALSGSASGKGHSALASVEMGKIFQISPNWAIEPQLQLVHQRISLDDTSIVGAQVSQDVDSGWLARAGVRVKGQIATGAGTLQPYARLNVYGRSSGWDVTRYSTPAAITGIATRTGGTSTELAAGGTWQLTPALSVYGEAGKLWASGGDARTKGGLDGSLGVKMRW